MSNIKRPFKSKFLVIIYICCKLLDTLRYVCKNDNNQKGLEIIVIIELTISLCVYVNRVLVVSNNKLLRRLQLICFRIIIITIMIIINNFNHCHLCMYRNIVLQAC